MANYFDELILAEIRKNNQAALGELYTMHYPMAVHLVCSNSGTEQEAKDVFQEAIIAFYERAHQPDFVLTCKIKTYLYAVCRRLWLKRLAERKRFEVTIAEAELFEGLEDEMEEVLQSEVSFERMQQSLHALGEPCRSIIEDFYIRGFSMELIREKFGYTSAENAKNQKYKCLQRLKKLFFEDHRKEK